MLEPPQPGWCAAFLLSDLVCHERFGFELPAARGLHYESDAFDAGFEILESQADSLDDVRRGGVYHPAFAGLQHRSTT